MLNEILITACLDADVIIRGYLRRCRKIMKNAIILCPYVKAARGPENVLYA